MSNEELEPFFIHKITLCVLKDDEGGMYNSIEFMKFPFFKGTNDELKEFACEKLRINLDIKSKKIIEVIGYNGIDSKMELLERKVEEYQDILDGNEDHVFETQEEKMTWLLNPNSTVV